MTVKAMAIAVLLFAPMVHAQAQSGIPLATPNQPPTRTFIPLDQEKEKNHGIAIIREKQPMKLRSDKEAMNSGGMRLDRQLLHPDGPRTLVIQPQQPAALLQSEVLPPVAATPAATATLDANPGALERDSEEIEGSNEGSPVLSLFGAGDITPSSFRDAMAGRSTGTVVGVAKQAVWPVALSVPQTLSSGYGMRADPFSGQPSFHGGIDIACAAGTPVVATSDAVVLQVAQDRNYGKYITLQHSSGMLSRYGHLSMQSVREGQHVRGGEVIGAVGATGRATGAHLDYRVSKDGMKFDPLSVLTVPTQVAMKVGSPVPLAVALRNSGPRVVTPFASAVASHPLPRGAMVIKVR